MMASRNEPLPRLLRVPPHIRQRIYRYVGLASWHGRPYNFDLHGPASECRNPWDLDQPSPHEFHGLLLSCRAIYKEAASLLYSSNRFILHYTDTGSFAPLLAMTIPALSSLTALKFVLNQASCHHRCRRLDDDGDCCVYLRRSPPCEPFKHHHRRHQFPLLSPIPESWLDDDSVERWVTAPTLREEWHAAVSHLSPHVTSRRLELSLVCDIDPQHEGAVGLAKSILDPLRLLPLLKSCHIRLGRVPDAGLTEVAQDAVHLKSDGITAPYRKPASTKTTFMTLPRELRLRILEFTNLVTPNKEVWWSRQHQGFVWEDRGDGACPDNDPKDWHCRHGSSECWYRRKTYVRTGTGLSIGCFCRRRHAAFSDTCTCWGPPTALFLVCRTLCEDVRFVFFSLNRFIVHDFKLLPWEIQNPDTNAADFGDPDRLEYDYPYERFTASHFLRDVVPFHCLAHLRFLELVFPPYLPRTWPPTNHPAMQDWRETVAWLRDKITGPALTLRVVGAEISMWTSHHYARYITYAEGDMIHRAHHELLEPLKQLARGADPLARFYADLQYPWLWTENATHRLREGDGRGSLWERKRELKEGAERLVLGDERYGGQYASGKEEPGQSLWKHVLYDHA